MNDWLKATFGGFWGVTDTPDEFQPPTLGSRVALVILADYDETLGSGCSRDGSTGRHNDELVALLRAFVPRVSKEQAPGRSDQVQFYMFTNMIYSE